MKQTADDTARATTHIQAVAKELHRDIDKQPQQTQLFLSGVVYGFAASIKIIDGGSAEDALQQMEQHLLAAVGQAFLNGTSNGQAAP